MVTRVHRGSPPSISPRSAPAAAPEEPPPAPSELPAAPEQSLAPITPEEVSSAPVEPEPPAALEQSLAPIAPEEVEVIGAAAEIAVAAEKTTALEVGAAAASEEPAPADPAAYPVNINTAELQTLIDLPGIGPALAARIIAYREQYGPFASIDQLMEVQGIGPSVLNEFRDFITVE
ncbi:MAG: ComEA family DNA-binding protein [Oscillochloris sp.]|nr:ComEA family DNA-binding protein [Oscillochloris sp.]